MTKIELKILYKQNKITAKEYFMKLAQLIKEECDSRYSVPVAYADLDGILETHY